jgi:hypothetical protein
VLTSRLNFTCMHCDDIKNFCYLHIIQNRKSLLGSHFKVCGAATAVHPTVGTVCVITMCGGFGPKPLDSATVVSVEAGDSPTAQFNRVLESIPVPQVLRKCYNMFYVNISYVQFTV